MPRVLPCGDLVERVPMLARMTVGERAGPPGVSTRRARRLLVGALVANAAIDFLAAAELLICPWALHEGIIPRAVDAMAGPDDVAGPALGRG